MSGPYDRLREGRPTDADREWLSQLYGEHLERISPIAAGEELTKRRPDGSYKHGVFGYMADTPIAAGGGSNMYDQREAELQATIQRLEAEIQERQRAHQSTIQRLTALQSEVENWKANYDVTVKNMADEFAALQSERDRLREALEEYAKIEGPPYHGTPFLARAALAGKD
jgi:hypothetical protein